MQRQGQPRLHKTLSQPALFFIPEKKILLRSMTAIEVSIVSRKEPRNSCVLVKIKMARHGARVARPGWLVTRDPPDAASCV